MFLLQLSKRQHSIEKISSRQVVFNSIWCYSYSFLFSLQRAENTSLRSPCDIPFGVWRSDFVITLARWRINCFVAGCTHRLNLKKLKNRACFFYLLYYLNLSPFYQREFIRVLVSNLSSGTTTLQLPKISVVSEIKITRGFLVLTNNFNFKIEVRPFLVLVSWSTVCK